MQDSATQAVRHRRVFYIPGYDPIHPRRYRELYRREGALQADVSGFDLELTPKRGDGLFGWHVDAQMDGAAIKADFEVLVWSDIVRDSMATSIPATYAQLIRTAWTYIGSGALGRLMRLRKGPVIAALYPVLMLILQLVLALLLGWLAARGILLLGMMAPASFDAGVTVLAWVAGLAVAVSVLRVFKARDGRLFAYYLMHDYAFTAQSRGRTPPELQARMDEFRTHIAEALTSGVDEVLVVGHSSGAHLAISVLADLIRSGQMPERAAALGFLSLGQVVPMVSFLPDAHDLRADLQYLSTRDELAWIDVSAPSDGAAFALCDPVAVSGVATDDKRWPLVFSAAYTQTLSPERLASLRWRFFRLHFQYLCMFDRAGDYDYFRVTAGPLTLRSRYHGRPASKSRIERAVSKYTSVRAA